MAAKPPTPPKRPAKPKRPANLPRGRWLGDFEPLSKVERQLVEHCASGTILTLGEERPEEPSAGNKIRAGIIRFLLLGGDDQNPAHEKGVIVKAAWIENALDLRQTHCRVRLLAHACRFEKEITADQAKIPALHLIGSSVPGLSANGIRVEGDLSLRDNFTSTGEVRMLGAEIGGDLACIHGSFLNEKGRALSADRLKVRGGVFLRENFIAKGQVRMLGAEIGGDLDCRGGTFLDEEGDALSIHMVKVKGGVFLNDKFTAKGQVGLIGAEITGDLSCEGGIFSNENGKALHADRISVEGSVFLRDSTATGEVRMLGGEIGCDLSCIDGTFSNEAGTALNLDGVNIRNTLFFRGGSITGRVALTGASAGTLVDDQTCYKGTTLLLDGFRYDRIVGPTIADLRIGWLNRQRRADLGSEFKPQPWEQLIRVLRDMGHPAEAAQIAMAKQEALRDAGQIGLRQPNPTFSGWRLALDKAWTRFSNFLARRLHWFYGWIAGYGHRPTRIVWRMALVCALCSLAYYGGRQNGLIGPSAPVLQMHPDLRRCGSSGDTGAVHWTSSACPMPPEYSTFQPFFYSLDVLIPFVDLHQETEWGPIVTNARGETLWWGRALRWILWFEIIFGWIASVMFVAIVGRLVDKD